MGVGQEDGAGGRYESELLPFKGLGATRSEASHPPAVLAQAHQSGATPTFRFGVDKTADADDRTIATVDTECGKSSRARDCCDPAPPPTASSVRPVPVRRTTPRGYIVSCP